MRHIYKKVRTDDSMFDKGKAESVAIIAELLADIAIDDGQQYARRVTLDIVMKKVYGKDAVKIYRMSIIDECDHEPIYKRFIRRLFKIK